MITIGTLEKAKTQTFPEHRHFRGSIDFLFEGAGDGDRVPQAFLVHQEPGSTLVTHYHLEEQFQVFVGGGGTIGAHAVKPVVVHYASRESGYGPLVAGPQGLDYFSLRAITHRGVHALPESRGAMTPGLRKRQKTVEQVDFVALDASPTAIIEPDDSGLGAWTFASAPLSELTLPRHPGGGGCFYLVVEGSVTREGAELGKHACIFSTPDEAPPRLLAGPGGAHLIAMQFPAAALLPRPGHPA